ncbi:hypothetical protein ZIOFF_069562 [Zingiber officinale]|uniref:Tf2-1-like SH3-like domain-containing protein n=1 Tax=Zingiber officinale TaxID=94328 RepID=A0A8J5CW01_ZINOF|nr:hypothetical protein ZIOFF_069562 [Zingiber officinale]
MQPSLVLSGRSYFALVGHNFVSRHPVRGHVWAIASTPIIIFAGTSHIESIDQELQTREQLLKNQRGNLLAAQNRMKLQYDSSHQEVRFEIGDMVLLKLQPYRQVSLASKNHSKLSPRFYWPFKIIDRVGNVAYKLQLPDHAKLHPVFHVSSLKKYHGSIPSVPTLSPIHQEDYIPSPLAVLDYCSHRHRGRSQILVHWEGLSPTKASWEDAVAIMERYPSFVFVDKLVSLGGSNVMDRAHTTKENLELIKYKRYTHDRFRKDGANQEN